MGNTVGYAGGIAGANTSLNSSPLGGIIKNCYNAGTVISINSPAINVYVGGIVGANSANIENCYNTGTITSTSTNDLGGGIVGVNVNGIVRACYNSGNITGAGQNGAIAGQNLLDDFGSRAIIENCYFPSTSSLLPVHTNTGAVTEVVSYKDTADLVAKMNTASGSDKWVIGASGKVMLKELVDIFPEIDMPMPSSTGEQSFAELERTYFMDFAKDISNAKAGDTITIDVKYYESLPTGLIDNLYGKDITVVLTNDKKEVAKLHGTTNVPQPSKSRAFYPVEYLMSL